MPLKLLIFSSALLCLSLNVVHAEDDYNFEFEDTDSQEKSDTGGGDGGDDLTFDDPVDVNSGGGKGSSTQPSSGGGGALPSFLQKSKDSERVATQTQKKLTPQELAAIRKAENKRVWVWQRRPFLKSERFELNTLIAQNINEPLVSFYTLGAQANYYLNEQMAIGLRGTYTLNLETSTFDDVIQDYQVFPQVSRPIWSVSLNFQYVPLYGKMSMFQTWIFPWELSVRGGAGWIQTFIDGHVLVTLGATQQFFLSRWFAFNIDLDYQVFQEAIAANSNEGMLLSNLTFGAGLSIYFPLDFEYKELK
jgi:outer membrane beta-barrel protein